MNMSRLLQEVLKFTPKKCDMFNLPTVMLCVLAKNYNSLFLRFGLDWWTFRKKDPCKYIIMLCAFICDRHTEMHYTSKINTHGSLFVLQLRWLLQRFRLFYWLHFHMWEGHIRLVAQHTLWNGLLHFVVTTYIQTDKVPALSPHQLNSFCLCLVQTWNPR